MTDHEYYESNEYVCSEDLSNERENDISMEEKDADALLIELYKKHPFLYDKTHNDFKNKIIRANAWKEISKVMQNKQFGNSYTSDYCQTRCTSLRNQYNREKRILNSLYNSGSTASVHKPFAFYSQLSFLDNYVTRRRRRKNIKANEVLSSSISSNERSINIPKCNINEVFSMNEESSDFTLEKEDNPNDDETNEENVLENSLQVIRKRAIDKDLDISNIKTVKYKKSKVSETKEVENISSSDNQKIISIWDNKHVNNEDEAFTKFIIVHLANLSQPERNIRKRMIADALLSPLQKM